MTILKLRTLKNEAKTWIKNKCDSMDTVTKSLDLAIESLLSGPSNGILSMDELAQLAQLRSEKQKILDHFLLTWQLKSRLKWSL